jgi:membrane associated rhomboid family serine protease
MRRYPSPAGLSYSFGPGPLSLAVKILLWTNIAMFVLSLIEPAIIGYLGLSPAAVLHEYRVWQPFTYLFLHDPRWFFHIIFNMLVLWMFGVELERLWGTRFFVKYYFVTGVGAALTTVAVGLLPFAFADEVYRSLTIGASGAIYGLLLAYALYFPNRPILFFFFMLPAKYVVLILGAIALLSSLQGGDNIAHATHLGGMAVGYVFLKFGGTRPFAEVKYRYFKWKMNRHRRRFDVYSGGRKAKDWDRRIH